MMTVAMKNTVQVRNLAVERREGEDVMPAKLVVEGSGQTVRTKIQMKTGKPLRKKKEELQLKKEKEVRLLNPKVSKRSN